MFGTFNHGQDVPREQLEGRDLGWLSTPKTTGATQIVAIDVHLEVGGGHGFHRHPDQEEFLYVISGTIEQWIGEKRRIISSGDSCFVPMDTVHASFNDSSQEARLLAILGPCIGKAGIGIVDVAGEEPWVSLR